MSTPSTRAQARSLYRALLRELPRRPLSSPSPLKLHLRNQFSSPTVADVDVETPSVLQQELQKTEQYVHYVQAQRAYTTLLERYNPGMDLDSEERIRLTARRVGMNLPVERTDKQNGDGK